MWFVDNCPDHENYYYEKSYSCTAFDYSAYVCEYDLETYDETPWMYQGSGATVLMQAAVALVATINMF